MRIIPAGRWLDCGCCGLAFKTWTGYEDQDQDQGYGICQSCQGHIKEYEQAELDKLVATLRGGLSEGNQAKFDAMDKGLQEALALDALDKGHIKYRIVRS